MAEPQPAIAEATEPPKIPSPWSEIQQRFGTATWDQKYFTLLNGTRFEIWIGPHYRTGVSRILLSGDKSGVHIVLNLYVKGGKIDNYLLSGTSGSRTIDDPAEISSLAKELGFDQLFKTSVIELLETDAHWAKRLLAAAFALMQ